MASAWLIAVKDLRLRVRDRSVFILGIVTPLALAFIFNAIFGSAASGTGLGLEYGLVDEDGSEISAAFGQVLEQIESDEVLTLLRYDASGDALEGIEEGEIDAYYVLPPGFGQAVTSNARASIEVVGDVDSPTSTQIAASIADQFTSGVESAQLAIATTAAIDPAALQALSGDPRDAAFSYQLTDISVAVRQLDPTTFFAAGMAVFFLFFTVQFGVAGILEEERQGTLTRLLAAPIRSGSVILGKAMLAFVLGVVSMGVLIVGTSLLMGANWGAPLGVAILVVAGVLSAMGIMGLVASAAQTPEGAGNLGGIIAVILGMLGGTFFPIGQGNDFLSNLSLLTPHAWFMQGLGDLGDGASWTAAVPAALAILVFAVVTGSVAALFLRRRMTT